MALLVEVRWVANPLRGDAFAEGWAPAAEAALDYGARYWALYRNADGRLDFIQHAIFDSKADFERYWYSETAATARAELNGYYQVPVTPTFWEITGSGQGVGAPSPG